MSVNTRPRPDGTETAILDRVERFPGARHLDEFRHNLRQGVESIRFLADEELESHGARADWLRAPNFVETVAALDGVAWFAVAFFGYTPREAESIDRPYCVVEDESDSYIVAETVWAISNRNLLDFFDRIEPERCHRLRYEDLVADPERAMRDVCRFLNVPFHAGVLQPYDGSRTRMLGGLGDPNILQHNRIESRLGETWKTIKWPRRLDDSTRHLATRLGYTLKESGPPSMVKADAPADLDQLSAEQVREMLQKMLAEEEDR